MPEEIYKQMNVNLDFRGHIIKDFSVQTSPEAPADPKVGQMYYDTTGGALRYYDGTMWNAMAYLDSTYKIPLTLLNIITSIDDLDEGTDDDLPTALLLKEKLALKQNVLTFDSAPTENSTNPVTSGGVYDAVQNVSTFISIQDGYYTITDNGAVDLEAGTDYCTISWS